VMLHGLHWAFPGNKDRQKINLDGCHTENLLFPDDSVLRAK
jgi:hypothetical protein